MSPCMISACDRCYLSAAFHCHAVPLSISFVNTPSTTWPTLQQAWTVCVHLWKQDWKSRSESCVWMASVSKSHTKPTYRCAEWDTDSSQRHIQVQYDTWFLQWLLHDCDDTLQSQHIRLYTTLLWFKTSWYSSPVVCYIWMMYFIKLNSYKRLSGWLSLCCVRYTLEDKLINTTTIILEVRSPYWKFYHSLEHTLTENISTIWHAGAPHFQLL